MAIRLRSLGDAVLITPAMRLLKEYRPDLTVTVVLDRPLAPLLADSLDVDHVIPVDRGRLRAAISAVRAEKPALCLNLHGGGSSAWMTLFSGARFRVGYEHYSQPFVYNIRVPKAQRTLGLAPEAVVHTAEHHASAMFHLGVRRREIPPARLYAKASGRQDRYAVLHIAAAYDTKRWPSRGFLHIARRLRDHYSLTPVIVAGPGSDELLRPFGEFELRPNLDVDRFKSLIGGAKLFVGGDSGPAHVAAALQVPSVVIFGSSDSRIWGPWKNRAEVVETKIECRPCPGDRCYAFEEPRCILSITPDTVERAVERVLAP